MPKTTKDSPPHPSMARLSLVAANMKPPVLGHSAIAKWLDVEPQVVTNWAKRGVSQDGALRAQTRAGTSAPWILRGTGEQFIQGTSGQSEHAVSEAPGPGYTSIAPPGGIDWAVQIIAEAMANLTPIGRSLAEPTLASIAKDPAQARTVIELLEVLIRSHGTPPAPPPKDKGTRKDKTQVAHARATGKPQLVVLAVSGRSEDRATHTQIPLLPLRTVDNPFREDLAPERERRNYARWTAPKDRAA